MKIPKTIIAGCLLLGVLATAPNASAVLIDLGEAAGNPADQEDRLDRLNGKIDIYNSANDPDLPEAVEAGSFKTNQGGTSITLDLTGWTYLVLKWANTDNYWYVAGEGSTTFDSTSFNRGNGSPQALSGYSLFNPTPSVPDAGATMVLFGAGLLGVGALRRRLGK